MILGVLIETVHTYYTTVTQLQYDMKNKPSTINHYLHYSTQLVENDIIIYIKNIINE